MATYTIEAKYGPKEKWRRIADTYGTAAEAREVICSFDEDGRSWEGSSYRVIEHLENGASRVLKPGDVAEEPPVPVDDGSCDPLYGQRADSADCGEA